MTCHYLRLVKIILNYPRNYDKFAAKRINLDI
jgi:hypothetical protein